MTQGMWVTAKHVSKIGILMDMHNTLESHKFFPIIAWVLVISFAFFTYFITTQVQAELDDVHNKANRLNTELSAT